MRSCGSGTGSTQPRKCTIEELLGRKSSGSGLEIREYGRRDPSLGPRGTRYPQKLALTSPTSGGNFVGVVRSRTHSTEFSFSLVSATDMFRKRILRQVLRFYQTIIIKKKTKLHGLSPLANYTDRATAACRRSECQLLRIEDATWSA
jgi:hypothetical protein